MARSSNSRTFLRALMASHVSTRGGLPRGRPAETVAGPGRWTGSRSRHPTSECRRYITFRKLKSQPRARGCAGPDTWRHRMVTRDTAWPSGTPCWVDLGVDDIAMASAFYAGLFGWEIQGGPPEAGGYAMCLANGQAVAGIGPKQGPPGTPAAWTTYLASDDVGQTARKVKAAGGRVLMEPMDIMDVGRMAVGADPGGAVFGIWQESVSKEGTTSGPNGISKSSTSCPRLASRWLASS